MDLRTEISLRCPRPISADAGPHTQHPQRAFEQIFKGHKFQPKVSIETTSIGIYRAVLSTTDRLSLFSRRDVDEDKTIGFEAIPYHSPRLQRTDGIAIRSDWKPTRIHLEFLERLAALAADRS